MATYNLTLSLVSSARFGGATLSYSTTVNTL